VGLLKERIASGLATTLRLLRCFTAHANSDSTSYAQRIRRQQAEGYEEYVGHVNTSPSISVAHCAVLRVEETTERHRHPEI